ncbi:MAG: DUF5011 domain-containing protein [Acholeplasmataceae bacterium]|nr:DUF5011 domain-containing protein [Acholeplasmataceae bacterium]
MKKIFSVYVLFLAVFVLVACEKEPVVENQAPTISGVQEEVEIDLGQTWNALDGVTASDPEDGSLTSSIVVTSIPVLTVTDGSVTPTETGDYYFTYTVEDSDGESVEAYATLSVIPVVSEKVIFMEYDFVEGAADLNGFNVGFAETAAGSFEAAKGVLSIDVTNNGDSDWHAKLFKNDIQIDKGNTYEFIIRMKASETIKLHYIINNADAGWNPFSGSWNLEVGTEFQDYSLEFLANENSLNTEFLLQFGGDNFDGFTNPSAFELIVDSILVIETPSVIEEVIHEDDFSTTDANIFEVSIGETAVGTSEIVDGKLNISLSENGDSDWHAKVFKNNIQIESGASYTFTVNMKASATVKMHLIINNAEAGWSPFGGRWNMEVGTDYQDYSLTFLAGDSSTNTEFLLQFGGDNFDGFTNPAAWDLSIDSITVTKATAATVETLALEDDFEDGDTVGWSERGEETHVASVSNVNNALSFQIDTYPVGNNPWEMDLYLATEYDIISGNTYKLVFDYVTLNDQFYELCFEDMNMDWQIRAGFKNGTLTGTGTLEFTFVAGMDLTDLYIKLSLGKAADGVESNNLTIDNLKLYEITGSTESEEELTDFSASGEDSPWGTFNNNEEGAYGTLYAEDGTLFYEIQSFGATDWFNKVFFSDITLTGGGLYTIEFTIKADQEVTGLAGLNVSGQWDPRIWENITVSETETTYSFTMEAMLMFDMNFEILMQFGFSTNVAPVTIEITSLIIYRQE